MVTGRRSISTDRDAPTSRDAFPLVASALVRVCAWCPPVRRRAVEVTAVMLGRRVTHGICPVCRDRLLAGLGKQGAAALLPTVALSR